MTLIIPKFLANKRNRKSYQIYKKERQAKHREYYLKNRVEILKQAREHWVKDKAAYKFRMIKRKFGLSRADYLQLLKKQRNVCALCRREQRVKGKKFLAVDHCHKTRKIRGLLCNHCNMVLGGVNDDTTILRRMIEYVESYV